MPQNCCVPFCTTNSKKNNNVWFHRFPKKQEQKDRWIAKIRRDEGIFFTFTDNTRVCSMHFCEEDYTVREDGKGKKTVLKKDAVRSIFQWSSKKRFRTTLGSKGKRKGESSEKTKEETLEKNLSAMWKEAWCHRETTNWSSGKKTAQLKELGDKVPHYQNENQKREHASALKEDKLDVHVCFSSENFRFQEKYIRFYTGIISWDEFLHLFLAI